MVPRSHDQFLVEVVFRKVVLSSGQLGLILILMIIIIQ